MEKSRRDLRHEGILQPSKVSLRAEGEAMSRIPGGEREEAPCPGAERRLPRFARNDRCEESEEAISHRGQSV